MWNISKNVSLSFLSLYFWVVIDCFLSKFRFFNFYFSGALPHVGRGAVWQGYEGVGRTFAPAQLVTDSIELALCQRPASE